MKRFGRSFPTGSPWSHFFIALLFLGFGTVSACAGGGDDPIDMNQTQPDVGTADVIEDTSEPDTGEDVVEDPCPVCCAGETRCADAETVEVCREDGTGFDVSATCGTGEICEAGACEVEPVCAPGERYCHSSTQLLVCRPNRTGYLTESCPTDTVCIIDECVSGAMAGETCDEHDDCAGGTCRCGDEESCAPDRQPYCTTQCGAQSCTGDQICWQSAGVEAASYDHCLRACEQECSFLPDRQCLQVLTDNDGDPEWRGACLPTELRGVGQRCDTDDECVNGECRHGVYSFGFCTHRCETDGCPSRTACVNLSLNGEYWCSPLCTDNGSHCPLFSAQEQEWNNYCAQRPAYGDGVPTVCTP